jgi:hypothetical protein
VITDYRCERASQQSTERRRISELPGKCLVWWWGCFTVDCWVSCSLRQDAIQFDNRSNWMIRHCRFLLRLLLLRAVWPIWRIRMSVPSDFPESHIIQDSSKEFWFLNSEKAWWNPKTCEKNSSKKGPLVPEYEGYWNIKNTVPRCHRLARIRFAV